MSIGLLLADHPVVATEWLWPEGVGCLLVGLGLGLVLQLPRLPFAGLLVGPALSVLVGRLSRGSGLELAALLGLILLATSCSKAVRLRGLTLVSLVSFVFLWRALQAWPSAAAAACAIDSLCRKVTAELGIGELRLGLSASYVALPWLITALGAPIMLGVGRTRITSTCMALGVGLASLTALHLVLREGHQDRHDVVQWAALTTGLFPAVLVGVWAARSHPANRKGIRTAFTAVVSTAMIFLSMPMWQEAVRETPDTGKWVLLDEGLVDWDKPKHGEYGAWSGGMFGNLPDALRHLGGSADLVKLSELDEKSLAEATGLIVLNLNVAFPKRTARALDDWLRSGGRMVLAADHTDVAGLMGPTNALCGKYGIRVRFDSAKAFGPWPRSWAPSLDSRFLAARTTRYLPYGVGASLDCSGAARPVLIGRHAFSDAGARTNLWGSFLGNYRVDEDEDVGDIVVGAEVDVGRGSVLVLGDTTPFQNTALRNAATRILPRLLESPPRVAPLSFVVLAILFLALAWFASSPTWGAALGATLGAYMLAVAAFAATLLSPERIDELAESASSSRVAFLVGQGSDTAGARPERRQDWALRMSAMRAGLFPVEVSSMSAAEVLPRFAVVVVSLPISRVENQTALLDYVAAGGHVLFVGGYRHALHMETLFASLGVSIAPAAIGRLPLLEWGKRSITTPSFASAFHVQLEPDATRRAEPLFRDGATLVCCRVRHGAGGVVILADEAFPYGDNLEGRKKWNPANLAFVQRLWDLMAGPSASASR